MNESNFERGQSLVARAGDAVWWHDGLLLEAAHFQQLCRRQEQLLSYHVRSAAPCNWGVRQLDIVDMFLPNGVFSIRALEAIMPDGLVVSHRPGAGHLELRLADDRHRELAEGRPDTICLAVPLGEAIDDTEGNARYAPVVPAGDDDGAAGVAHVRPRLRLALASDLAKQGNDVVLPLARVALRSGKFELERFLPPLLDIGWQPPWLGGKSLRLESEQLVSAMERAAGYLVEATRKRPAEVNDKLHWLELRQRLASVVAGIPVLHGVLGLDGQAPLALYLAWCGALGPLGALDDTGDLGRGVFPAYRHDALAPTFGALFGRIRALLAMADGPFLEVQLERHTDQQFSHAFDRAQRYDWPALETVAPGASARQGAVLIIGIRGLPEDGAAAWLQKAVITSSAQLKEFREERRMGLRRSLVLADGRLQLLAGKALPYERQVDVRGMASAGACLFALDQEDPEALDIVLHNGAEKRPAEVVLFIHKGAS